LTDRKAFILGLIVSSYGKKRDMYPVAIAM